DGAALVGVFHQAQQLFVARLTQFHFEHQAAAGLYIVLLELLDRLAGEPVAQHILFSHQLLDEWFPFVVLVCRNSRRPADDKRGPRFIDENGIDFIDDRIEIAALYLLFARRGHTVVAQIVEAELAVGAVRDVHRVLLAADVWFLIVLNATDR